MAALRLPRARKRPGADGPAGVLRPDAELRRAFDDQVAGGLPRVGGILGGLYVAFAASHLLLLSPGLRGPMAALAAASAALFFAVARRWRGRPVSPRWAHPVAALMAGIVLANSQLHLALTRTPSQTTNLMLLLLVGAALFLLDARWLAPLAGLAWLGWVGVAATSEPSPGWTHYGCALLCATALSAAAWTTRACALRRLLELTRSEAGHRAELERAREQLETRVLRRAGDLHRAGESLRAEIALRESREQALRREKEAAEANDRAKSELMGIAAHELRNPLAPLRLGVQHLRLCLSRGQPTDPALVERLDRLSARMTRMVGELLDVTCLERGPLELRSAPLDLRELVREGVEAFRCLVPARRVALLLPRGPVPVVIDPGRVGQVLDNLLDNAAKYSLVDRPIEVSVTAIARGALVEVSDRGPGIPRELRTQLFTRFFRGPGTGGAPGLGLGLYVCRQIVERHGGSMTLDSRPGKGSRFGFLLPMAGPPSLEPGRPRGPEPVEPSAAPG